MDKPIRVLHILQRMEAGGTQALLMNIYRKLDRSKVQFDFLVEYPDRQFYDDEVEKLGGKIYYSTVRKDLNIFKFTKYMEKILLNHPEYHIVHVHTYSIGYFCLKTAKKLGIPVRIAHSHSNAMTTDYKRYIKLVMQKLYTICATDLMACSDEAGKYLFGNKDFKVLPNAIDSAKFIANLSIRQKVREELKLENNFVVGHVGRFKPEKNHKFLIDIFAKIREQIPDAKLLMIGNGDPSEEIQEYIAQKRVFNDVVILKNRKDVHRLYQAMDIFVFPSRFEGLGIVAIEAQAAGVPIVCSEGLPPETNITPIYRRLLLSDGAEKWATAALEMAQNPDAHTNMQQYIIDAGFDMDATAKYMENYYLNQFVLKK